jgi:hypothetical protein
VTPRDLGMYELLGRMNYQGICRIVRLNHTLLSTTGINMCIVMSEYVLVIV